MDNDECTANTSFRKTRKKQTSSTSAHAFLRQQHQHQGPTMEREPQTTWVLSSSTTATYHGGERKKTKTAAQQHLPTTIPECSLPNDHSDHHNTNNTHHDEHDGGTISGCDDGPRRGQRRGRRETERVNLTVPVSFKRELAVEDQAHLLSEVLRHVLFSRGQLPMPSKQLLKVLEEREESDREHKQEQAEKRTGDEKKLSSSERSGEILSGHRLTERGKLASRNGETVARKGRRRRELARATAHRRAKKTLDALRETTDRMEGAFVRAAAVERPVVEAIILFGASHLSPREIYSVTFPKTRSPRVDGAECSSNTDNGLRSKLPDAYSRKLVRALVGGTSSVLFRGIGACRVHIFYRLAEFHPDLNVDVTEDDNDFSDGTRVAQISQEFVPPRRVYRSKQAYPHHLVAPPPPEARLLHLTPRPGFKIRESRTRPAPKVSIALSTARPTMDEQNLGCGATCGSSGAEYAEGEHLVSGRNGVDGETAGLDWGEGTYDYDSGGIRVHEMGGSDVFVGEGWHQLDCVRLAGLKGCDALAN